MGEHYEFRVSDFSGGKGDNTIKHRKVNAMIKYISLRVITSGMLLFMVGHLTACAMRIGQTVISKCEAFLTVTTEKKTDEGWEMRRLLEKEQYMKIFYEINAKVYEEMSKIE
jgi:hypothetical protein